jgi:hypothetical protein
MIGEIRIKKQRTNFFARCRRKTRMPVCYLRIPASGCGVRQSRSVQIGLYVSVFQLVNKTTERISRFSWPGFGACLPSLRQCGHFGHHAFNTRQGNTPIESITLRVYLIALKQKGQRLVQKKAQECSFFESNLGLKQKEKAGF